MWVRVMIRLATFVLFLAGPLPALAQNDVPSAEAGAAISRAIAMASSISFSRGTTAVITPRRCSSAAGMRRAVKYM